jgi:hypothetical protein
VPNINIIPNFSKKFRKFFFKKDPPWHKNSGKNFSRTTVPRPTSRKNGYLIGDTEGREGRGI